MLFVRHSSCLSNLENHLTASNRAIQIQQQPLCNPENSTALSPPFLKVVPYKSSRGIESDSINMIFWRTVSTRGKRREGIQSQKSHLYVLYGQSYEDKIAIFESLRHIDEKQEGRGGYADGPQKNILIPQTRRGIKEPKRKGQL